MDEGNLTAQVEEVEALSSIYADDWIVECAASRKFIINIAKDIHLQVRLTDGYPSHAPPHFELDAVPLSGADRIAIADTLNMLYEENMGEPILYIWVEAVRDYLSRVTGSDLLESTTLESEPPAAETLADSTPLAADDQACREACPKIFHDEPITDRKSTFQAHVASVTDLKQVSLVMRTLLNNKKISAATHNIQAYRIKLSNGSIVEDCDDDGETHAASRVLHLLNIVGAVNVLVVVSRWYGGIQLGPDRFKHINNCARNVLEKQNFITSPSKAKNSTKKSSQRKS